MGSGWVAMELFPFSGRVARAGMSESCCIEQLATVVVGSVILSRKRAMVTEERWKWWRGRWRACLVPQ